MKVEKPLPSLISNRPDINQLPNMGSSMGSFKLNTCVVSSEKPPSPDSSGYGGILRDERGCWIRGFMGHCKTGFKHEAELLAMFKGIELVDSLRLQNTTLETDSLFALDILKNPVDKFTKSLVWRAKILNYQKLVEKNGITLNSITPEENKCAAFLAKLAIVDDDEYEDVLDPPPGIESLIVADRGSVPCD